MSTLKIFNTQLLSFAESLCTRFPANKSLKLAYTGIDTLKQCNPAKTLDLFVSFCYKYKNIIMEKNEELLMNTNFVQDDLQTNDADSMNIMNNLKGCWSELESDEKENIWKYMQVLFRLCDKAVEERAK